MTQWPNGDSPPRSQIAQERAVLASGGDDDVLYDVVVNSARTELLAAAIDRGLRNNKVSWARLYRDIAQKIGRRFEVDAEIVHRLGVQLPEAKAAVDAMRGASDDEHEVAARCREFLDSYERKRGNRVLVLPFAAEVSDADSD